MKFFFPLHLFLLGDGVKVLTAARQRMTLFKEWLEAQMLII